MKLRWCCAWDSFCIANFSDHRSKVLWPSGLGSYFICKKLADQILLWSLEFVAQSKSRARNHHNLKLDSKLKYLNKNWIIMMLLITKYFRYSFFFLLSIFRSSLYYLTKYGFKRSQFLQASRAVWQSFKHKKEKLIYWIILKRI